MADKSFFARSIHFVLSMTSHADFMPNQKLADGRGKSVFVSISIPKIVSRVVGLSIANGIQIW